MYVKLSVFDPRRFGGDSRNVNMWGTSRRLSLRAAILAKLRLSANGFKSGISTLSCAPSSGGGGRAAERARHADSRKVAIEASAECGGAARRPGGAGRDCCGGRVARSDHCGSRGRDCRPDGIRRPPVQSLLSSPAPSPRHPTPSRTSDGLSMRRNRRLLSP